MYKTFYIGSEYYNSATCSYFADFTDVRILSNHAIAVVGWDDDYPKDNFLLEHQPNNNGAWLIKNSYGSHSSDNGYMWISYEDDSFNSQEDAAVFTKIDKVSKNEHMLSYDFLPLGNTTSILELGTNCKYICNVYDVSELIDEYGSINKVMFYTSNIDDFYRIYIVPVNENGTLPDINSLSLNYCAYGSINYEGYITEELKNPYVLETGVDKYAIIVKYITFDTSIDISQESNGGWNSYMCKWDEGQSYIYENGQWLDVAKGDTSVARYSFCIRPTLVRRTPITQDSQLSVSTMCTNNVVPINISLNGNLLYRIWNGDEKLHEDKDFYRSGNTITFDDEFIRSLDSQFITTITFEFTDGENQVLKIYPKALSDVNISGKAAQGQTLTANAIYSDVTIPAVGDVYYQWQSSDDGSVWDDISGANACVYTLTSNDRGDYIRCTVSVSDTVNNVLPETKYSASTATKVVRYGDADLDGDVDAFDSTEIQRYIANIIEFSAEQFIAADVTGDGVINTFDTTAVQRYIAGYITSFPVET